MICENLITFWNNGLFWKQGMIWNSRVTISNLLAAEFNCCHNSKSKSWKCIWWRQRRCNSNSFYFHTRKQETSHKCFLKNWLRVFQNNTRSFCFSQKWTDELFPLCHSCLGLVTVKQENIRTKWDPDLSHLETFRERRISYALSWVVPCSKGTFLNCLGNWPHKELGQAHLLEIFFFQTRLKNLCAKRTKGKGRDAQPTQSESNDVWSESESNRFTRVSMPLLIHLHFSTSDCDSVVSRSDFASSSIKSATEAEATVNACISSVRRCSQDQSAACDSRGNQSSTDTNCWINFKRTLTKTGRPGGK